MAVFIGQMVKSHICKSSEVVTQTLSSKYLNIKKPRVYYVMLHAAKPTSLCTRTCPEKGATLFSTITLASLGGFL